jgi:hypothetical protein
MGTLRDRLARWRWVLAFFPRTGVLGGERYDAFFFRER